MGLFDYFKPVSSWTVEEVRTVLRERNAESCNLVDVRQEAASIFLLLGQATRTRMESFSIKNPL